MIGGMRRLVILAVAWAILAPSQVLKISNKLLLRFEDYTAVEKWDGQRTPVKLTSTAERTLRTRLTEASRQAPNFAGHYRFVTWRCRSNCVEAAIIDLQTGEVIQHPMTRHEQDLDLTFCRFHHDGDTSFRLDSRLMIVRCQWDIGPADIYYFEWQPKGFKELAVTRDQPLQTGTSWPRFNEYNVDETWQGPAASVRLTTKAERRFQTRLMSASKERPNFAGHYRFTGWGCGSNCASAALIDLQTGQVFPPPLGGYEGGRDPWISCPGLFASPYAEYRLDSRLMVIRCSSREPMAPDLHYYVWEGLAFREILFICGKLQ